MQVFRILFVMSVSIALAGCTTSLRPIWDEPDLQRLASPQLQTFTSAEEVAEYLAATNAVLAERRERERRLRERRGDQSIVVTGSRVMNPPSITNNQVTSVDEGDIVKRIGDYLLVLQDGRIFVSNFRTMEMTDRVDVYRTASDGSVAPDAWYDEMLVGGENVIVVAYNYERNATEVNSFRLQSDTGKLISNGTFFVPSADYYSRSNYASRLVGNDLLLYAPVSLSEFSDPQEMPRFEYLPASAPADGQLQSSQMLLPEMILRPVFGLADPVVHLFARCPLDMLNGADLECRVQGVVGSRSRELYVDEDAVYLITEQASYGYWYGVARRCDRRSIEQRILESAIFRIPHGSESPTVLGSRSMPLDQFGISRSAGRLRILLAWEGNECVTEDNIRSGVALLDEPLSAFSDRYVNVEVDEVRLLPDVAGTSVQNRFIGDWLVYGSRENHDGSRLYEEEEPVTEELVVAVPLEDIGRAQEIGLGHQLRRLERLGDGLIVTGYDSEGVINISRITLSDTAQLAGQTTVPLRVESEGRSHSFNYRTEMDGNGILALPTVQMNAHPDGAWYGRPSDITYLTFGADGSLDALGNIEGLAEFGEVRWDEEGDGEWMEYPSGYRCEVSCIDWYGNARPIFIERSVFALMGTELVEGQVDADAISVARRLDLTVEPAR